MTVCTVNAEHVIAVIGYRATHTQLSSVSKLQTIVIAQLLLEQAALAALDVASGVGLNV
jgi:hypothetical protein